MKIWSTRQWPVDISKINHSRLINYYAQKGAKAPIFKSKLDIVIKYEAILYIASIIITKISFNFL